MDKVREGAKEGEKKAKALGIQGEAGRGALAAQQ